MDFFKLDFRKSKKTASLLSLFIFSFAIKQTSIYALPVDFSGTFGVDSSFIEHYRRTTEIVSSPDNGSQYISATPGQFKKASFQSYKFKLNPSIIINDSATFYGELTTGYGYGGKLGDSPSQRKDGASTFAVPLYLHNTLYGSSNITLGQFYLELFSDVATYRIGRHSAHWGLGVLYNNGKTLWDHHASIRDGITMDFKISNIQFSPYYSKINSKDTLSKEGNTKAYGISVLYEQIENDLSFGILLGRQRTESSNNHFQSKLSSTMIGSSQVKITDLFFKKKFFKKLLTSVEIPIISGNMKNVYATEDSTKYKANAIIFESEYLINESWSLGLKMGQISGDDGIAPNFEAFYLNPNYQVANLMYRYNLRAVNDSQQSIYDSNMVNTKYLSLYSNYKNEGWLWDLGIVVGFANEVAKAGQQAYNHQTNTSFAASYDQLDDLGYELDFGFKYTWNPNIKVTGQFGYHFVGDYFAYQNTATPLKLHNSYMTKFGVMSTF